MRIIGVFPRENQVGGVVDSLKRIGFDRKDMIISDIAKTPSRHSRMDNIYIKTEADSLQSLSTLSEALSDEVDTGIIVSVEIPQRESSKVREIMEQNGATKIMQD